MAQKAASPNKQSPRKAKVDTKMWKVNPSDSDEVLMQALAEPAKLLAENQVVGFPTETVYGLGGNAYSDLAVERIYGAKGRPSDNPLIVHVATQAQFEDLVETVTPMAKALTQAFWPGPLTVILKNRGNLSKRVTAGLDTVAIRMPSHRVALALIRASNVPIAAPSANLSGRPSPTTAAHVWEDLSGVIAGVVDGGPTGVGLESTIVDCTQPVPIVLRPGGVTREDILRVIGQVQVDTALHASDAPRAPGMKYTHYKPRADFRLVRGSTQFMLDLVKADKKAGKCVGVMTVEEGAAVFQGVADVVVTCGHATNLSSVAQGLYHALRSFDSTPVSVIYCEVFPTHDVGLAIMNRLMKAAGQEVIIQPGYEPIRSPYRSRSHSLTSPKSSSASSTSPKFKHPTPTSKPSVTSPASKAKESHTPKKHATPGKSQGKSPKRRETTVGDHKTASAGSPSKVKTTTSPKTVSPKKK